MFTLVSCRERLLNPAGEWEFDCRIGGYLFGFLCLEPI